MEPLRSVILFTSDPWESALPALRVTGPARACQVDVIRGNEGERVFAERIDTADLVIIQRHFPFDPGYEAVLRRARSLGIPVVYEIDDLLFELPEDHISLINYSEYSISMLQAALQADAVVTSTPALKEYLSTLNRNVWIYPNLLDDTLWPLDRPTRTPGDPTVIGYMGGQTHLQDLETLSPVLTSLCQAFGDKLALKFWGCRPPEELMNLPRVEWFPVDILDYPEFVRFFSTQTADIMVAPLRENRFNRCKSPIKYLEYSSMGIPGVYSAAGPYTEIVDQGVNGYLAGAPEEWNAVLSRLIGDVEIRQAAGQRAQQTVREGWSLSQQGLRWIEVYSQILTAYHSHNLCAGENPLLPAVERINRFQQLLRDQKNAAHAHQLELIRELEQSQAHLQAVLASRSWRMLQRLQTLREGILPVGSQREAWVKKIMRRSR